MTKLDPFLDVYAPPAVPDGLAERAAAAAIRTPQERGPLGRWARGPRRRGWRRSVFVGSAAVSLAFTSAVAAEVVSGGRLEIPVVHQVVVAIPALRPSTHESKKPVQLASRTVKPAPTSPEPAATPEPETPATPRERMIQKFTEAKKQVEERRAAGLPTPNADRIERKAKRIVERREAAGLPAPSLDEVELRVAMREWRTIRILRQVARDPSAITDVQVQRFSRILPPQKRGQFLALGPEQQRQVMSRAAQRFLVRRLRNQVQAASRAPAEVAEQQ